MVEEKENFEKVVDFRVRFSLALITCREIETIERK